MKRLFLGVLILFAFYWTYLKYVQKKRAGTAGAIPQFNRNFDYEGELHIEKTVETQTSELRGQIAVEVISTRDSNRLPVSVERYYLGPQGDKVLHGNQLSIVENRPHRYREAFYQDGKLINERIAVHLLDPLAAMNKRDLQTK